MSARRRPTTLLFDLDGTLYPGDHDYLKRVRAQVLGYMRNELQIENAEIFHKRVFGKYNQTLRGKQGEKPCFSFNTAVIRGLHCLTFCIICTLPLSVCTQGLRSEGFVIDDELYWQAVRSGTKESLKPDEGVKKALASLTQGSKFIFTNTAEKACFTCVHLPFSASSEVSCDGYLIHTYLSAGGLRGVRCTWPL